MDERESDGEGAGKARCGVYIHWSVGNYFIILQLIITTQRQSERACVCFFACLVVLKCNSSPLIALPTNGISIALR